MANRKVSPSTPVNSSGQASKLPWVASDRLTDPDDNVLMIDSDPKQVEVTADDTTPGYLNAKLAVAAPISKTVLNPAAAESIELGITSPADTAKVLVGSDPVAFGFTPLKSVGASASPAWAVPSTKGQPTSFSVTIPESGTYAIYYSGWVTSDGAGVAELDLYNDTDTAVLANTERKLGLESATEGSVSTGYLGSFDKDDVVYPRWAYTGANNASLQAHTILAVRVGA